jgi:hypothetical protein
MSLQDRFRTHCIALLYGPVKPLTGKVRAHCCLEPAQVGTAQRVDLGPAFDVSVFSAIAALLGMQCVEIAISGPFDAKMPLHPYVILRVAKYQHTFGEYFLTLIMSPAQEHRGRVGMEAFQVKDLAVRLAVEK